MPLVNEDLRRIARRQLAIRVGGGTLPATGLVPEAYLKLAEQARVSWRDRARFYALSALAMRHVLIDRTKARLTQKRGGARQQVTLDEELVPTTDQPEVPLQLSEAIDRLAAVGPRLATVVNCRFFAGMTEEEVAEALGVTAGTVQRDWAKARMLLRRALAP